MHVSPQSTSLLEEYPACSGDSHWCSPQLPLLLVEPRELLWIRACGSHGKGSPLQGEMYFSPSP